MDENNSFISDSPKLLYPVHVYVELYQGYGNRLKKHDGQIVIMKELILKQLDHGEPIVDGLVAIPENMVDVVKKISVDDLEDSKWFEKMKPIGYQDCKFSIHLYENQTEEMEEEMTDDDDQLPACSIYMLPSVEFDGLWQSLIYEPHLKSNLLQYIQTTLLFSSKQVNNQLINWNRVILLYGPPGTGKTSLSKALANRLSMRMSETYPNGGQLVEINAHSLFSKWFSESGKLVMKLFRKIHEMIEDQDAFVVVLIDEVESLTSARQKAVSGSEPMDSVRSVNAVLTQLDSLKNHPNVLIICTSNLDDILDSAFSDRIDLKQYIGLPNTQAREVIINSCIQELIRKGIIFSTPNLERESLLNQILENTKDTSGRFLRKLPLIAHATEIQMEHCSEIDFLKALVNTTKLKR